MDVVVDRHEGPAGNHRRGRRRRGVAEGMSHLDASLLEGEVDLGPQLAQRGNGRGGPQGVTQEAVAPCIFNLSLTTWTESFRHENTSRTYMSVWEAGGFSAFVAEAGCL